MKITNSARSAIFFTFIFFYSCVALFIKDSSSYIYIFLILSIFTISRTTVIGIQIKNNIQIKFLLALLTFILYLSFQEYINGYSASRLRAYVFSFLFLSVMLNTTVSDRAISCLLLISSVTSLAFILYFNTYLNTPKYEWFVTASTISSITVSIAALSLYHLSFENDKKKCFLLSFICCFSSIALSSTRTAWVSIIIILSVVLYLKRKDLITVMIENKFIFFTLAIATIIILPISIETRVTQTLEQIQKVINNDSYDSIGLRLEMWKTTFIIIEKSYFLGLGDNFKNTLFEYAELGKVNPLFLHWLPNHLHSEYFDRLAKQGLVGSIYFMFFIGYLLKISAKKKESKPAALMILALLINGITDASFELLPIIPLYLSITYLYLNRSNECNT